MSISIAGLDKAVVLAALFNRSHQQGMGVLQKHGAVPMTVAEAVDEIKDNPNMYFDYLRGRVLKVDLKSDELRTDLYNRDVGEGAAEEVINDLKDGR